ncbi:hypothetical protein ERJ75_000610100 [Trypanosoma vivax]|nr:hypothetical protein ERJ75_000610100 [Trypanosoma vivax]
MGGELRGATERHKGDFVFPGRAPGSMRRDTAQKAAERGKGKRFENGGKRGRFTSARNNRGQGQKADDEAMVREKVPTVQQSGGNRRVEHNGGWHTMQRETNTGEVGQSKERWAEENTERQRRSEKGGVSGVACQRGQIGDAFGVKCGAWSARDDKARKRRGGQDQVRARKQRHEGDVRTLRRGRRKLGVGMRSRDTRCCGQWLLSMDAQRAQSVKEWKSRGATWLGC